MQRALNLEFTVSECVFPLVFYIHLKPCVEKKIGECSFNCMNLQSFVNSCSACFQHLTLSRAEGCECVLALSEAMTPMLYNLACGFASGEEERGD